MTNADKIRKMTDEEMAKMFRPNGHILDYCPQECPAEKYRCWMDCNSAWLDWLKQEVSDGGPIVDVVVKGNCASCGKPLSDEDGVFLCIKCRKEVTDNG